MYVLAVIIYFTSSGISYLVLYVWRKEKYVPRRKELMYDRENYWFDIKWSLLNILGQVPLITLIKMGYPYFSKVQYSWNITPVFWLYLALHIIYD